MIDNATFYTEMGDVVVQVYRNRLDGNAIELAIRGRTLTIRDYEVETALELLQSARAHLAGQKEEAG